MVGFFTVQCRFSEDKDHRNNSEQDTNFNFIFSEEILGQNSAMWFSPDSTKLAYVRFNDSQVQRIQVMHFYRSVCWFWYCKAPVNQMGSTYLGSMMNFFSASILRAFAVVCCRISWGPLHPVHLTKVHFAKTNGLLLIDCFERMLLVCSLTH